MACRKNSGGHQPQQCEPVAVTQVAKFVQSVAGTVSDPFLHRLLYYMQVWHVVLIGVPCFVEELHATFSGPVVANFGGTVNVGDSLVTGLCECRQDTVYLVLKTYGVLGFETVSEMARSEEPWRRARRGLRRTSTEARVISVDSLRKFYPVLGVATTILGTTQT